MTAKIIDGKTIAQKIREKIKNEIKEFKQKPGLAVILVGNDEASNIYVKNKEKDCQEIGFYSEIHKLPEDISEEKIKELINKLNNSDKIHGIIVQLPLPNHIKEETVINTILPEKDVDGFTYINAGKLFTGNKGLLPCTPAGCIELIKSTGVEIKGKEAVVIGRSNIVGKPMAMLLMQEHATITICHSKTKNLKEITKRADILVAAIGKPKMITEDMVKDGAIIIDVGMNKDENGKLCGDVDFENVKEKVSYITPVPGGVGPMTRAMLMKNTLTAYLNINGGKN
ncbi:MAG: bifunctional methylenetetrahydrofolate dehydrogenase/methenyltetrahydrofolate cyclohydrolase FolD [Candidatus Goldbacteria bacterium]|nr:bifunctional methylenetetrahydrofolate dehydrogenase/methenyltetrahydrofolate cyclohydrolase FolD [Candidatus Goldiibacteriota bacterium]